MSKKVVSFSFFLLICLATCTEIKAQTNNETQQTPKPKLGAPKVGGNKDEHGCYTSAGYTWSVLKNECIQIFKSGIRLDPKAENLNKSLSAFIVFKTDIDDDAKVEIYIPNDKKSIILDKDASDEAGKWKNDTYTLTQYRGMYSLEDSNKTLLYQGLAVK